MNKKAAPIANKVAIVPLKIQAISFDDPAFRKLGKIKIEIAPRLTLIAGRNGVGKSTVLALIAGGSGLTRGGAKIKTYLGSLPNVWTQDILKLSYERDFVQDELAKPNVLLTYEYKGQQFQKKGNVSGSEERLRIVPRNEPNAPLEVQGLVIPKDGKVPLPTIYLGMTRVMPIGEVMPEHLETSQMKIDEEDYRIYDEFTNRVISTGNDEMEPLVTAQSVVGTKKKALYPKYNGYEASNVSLGQDSLSAIATALASFSKLKRELKAEYRGGILIIDEVDAGFHPHAQIQLLEELKSKARELSIQVIATTHSLTMLENAHADIYNNKYKGRPQDQIIYLKAGRPIDLLDAKDFDAIYNDMHMLLSKPPTTPIVKVYVEDDEAALFLTAILTAARKRAITAKTGVSVKVIAAKVGCSNLINLLKADEYFESVVIVLDGDTGSVNAGNAKNVVRLPADPLNTEKQSPEVILKAMCQSICGSDDSYPQTRKKLKAIGGDTTFIEDKILKLQRGEQRPAKTVETDRDVAKNWFNLRLTSITEMKLIEGWVADNIGAVDAFILKFEEAVKVAARKTTMNK